MKSIMTLNKKDRDKERLPRNQQNNIKNKQL